MRARHTRGAGDRVFGVTHVSHSIPKRRPGTVGLVPRNVYSLAALAAAAVPGLIPDRTVALPAAADDLDVAGVQGQDGRRVVVTAPASPAAGVLVEKETRLGEALSGTRLADLVPHVVGSAKLAEGGRAVVTDAPHGVPLHLEDVAEDAELARSLGELIARIHAVPGYMTESSGAESFTAAALHERHRTQLRRAQETGDVPASVVQRWEAMLADEELWHFVPTFVHGNLSEDSLFRTDATLTGVTGWWEARIGDPATDLAWLIPTLDPERFDELFSAYQRALPMPTHPRLLERAQAVGELAVLDWLLHGVENGDESIVHDARGMLADLDEDIAQIAREEAEQEFDSVEQRSSSPEN